MRSIFVGSTGGGPGQTLATWALAVALKKRKLEVGFFKPFGLLPETAPSAGGGPCDSDVVLLRGVLGLQEADEFVCPVRVSENLLPEVSPGEDLLEKLRSAYHKISSGKDIVLIMGAKEIFFGEGLSGLSDSVLVKSFNASVLLVDRYLKDNMTLYSLLSLSSFLDGRVKCAIINHVAPDRVGYVKEKVIPFLKEKGLKSALAIPEDSVLSAFTIRAIAGLVGGEVLCCPEHLANMVETFTIGSKPLEGSLSIFKQVYNKIILSGLGGAGREGRSVGGILLTGGKVPGELILNLAQERSIPLILTRLDTFQAMEKLEKAKPPLTLQDEFKVSRFLEFIEREIGINEWVETLIA